MFIIEVYENVLMFVRKNSFYDICKPIYEVYFLEIEQITNHRFFPNILSCYIKDMFVTTKTRIRNITDKNDL